MIADFGGNVLRARGERHVGFPGTRSKIERFWISRLRLRGPWNSSRFGGPVQRRFWITWHRRRQRPLHSGHPKPEHLGDHSEGRPVFTKSKEFFTVYTNTRTTYAGSSPLGGGKPSTGPFNQDGLFKFRESRHEVNEELALRARAVEGLRHRGEAHAEGVQLRQGVHHVPQAAEQPVGPPDEEDVELALPGVGHHPVESRPLLPGARDPVVHEGVHEVPAPAFDERGGLVLLEPWVLVEAGDANVTDGS